MTIKLNLNLNLELGRARLVWRSDGWDKKCVILLWSASGSHDNFSALEARRNVKMVSFERSNPNLNDNIEFVAVCG